MARTKQTARKSFGHTPPRKKPAPSASSQNAAAPPSLPSSVNESVVTVSGGVKRSRDSAFGSSSKVSDTKSAASRTEIKSKSKIGKKEEVEKSGSKRKAVESNTAKIAKLKRQRKETDKEIAKLEELEKMKRKVAKLEEEVAKMAKKK